MNNIISLPTNITWTEDLQKASNDLVDTVGSVANDVSPEHRVMVIKNIIQLAPLSAVEKAHLVKMAPKRYESIAENIQTACKELILQ